MTIENGSWHRDHGSPRAISFIADLVDIIGGRKAPKVAAHIAENYVIHNIFIPPFSGLTVRFLACFPLYEIAPRKIVERALKTEANIILGVPIKLNQSRCQN